MTVRLAFEWRDIWVGMFLDPAKHRAYLCLLPCVPIILSWGAHRADA